MCEVLRLRPKGRKAGSDWIDRFVIFLSGKEVLRILTAGFLKVDDGENLLEIRLLKVVPEEGTILLQIRGYAFEEGEINTKRTYEAVGSLSFNKNS